MGSGDAICTDDDWLLNSVRKFKSLNDYFSSYFQYGTLDRQPVRDLSIYIDDAISSWIGFPIFRITNVAIWVISLFIFQRILALFAWPSIWIQGILLYIGTHPVAVNSVGMFASRKHLLSVFFTLCIFYFILKFSRTSQQLSWRQATLILFCYLLGCLSQPLQVLTPLGFIFFIDNKKEFILRNKKIIFGFILIAGAILLDNYLYYASEVYAKTVGYSKFAVQHGVLKRFFIYGRSFFQVVFPGYPSILPYELGKIKDWIGWIFLFIFALILLMLRLKKGKMVERFFWPKISGAILLFFLPLLVVTIRVTIQGGWDTYLLFSLFAWAIFLKEIYAATVQESLAQSGIWTRRAVAGIAAGAISFNTTISYQHAQYFISPEKVFQRMSILEHSNLYRMMYAHVRINNHPDQVDEIYQDALQVYESDPRTANLGYVLGRSLVYTGLLSSSDKFSLWEKLEVPSFWWHYWKAVFYVKQAQPERANEIMTRAWEIFKEAPLDDVDKFEEIVSNWIKMCDLAKKSECEIEIRNKVRSRLETR